MRYTLALLLMICASSAHAQRMRDHSLSPQETMRQPDITHSQGQPTGSTWSNNFEQNHEGTGHTQNLPYGETGYGQTNSRFFMNQYCSEHNRPVVRSQRVANITNCLEDIKSKACDAFSKLPADAQASVDGAAECIFSMEDTPYTETRQCGQFERQQLALVKKYWNNPETAYAIVFIPDMVANPMIFCERR